MKFYILWVEGSTKPPTYKFATLEEAEKGARKLSILLVKDVNVMEFVSQATDGRTNIRADKPVQWQE